ncbi:MAG: hypothetical protein V4792_12505 [Pseudomonadota bacterium]
MTTQRIHQDLSPLEHAHLFEAARRAGVQARREAIDAFWAAVGRVIARALVAGRQSLHRAAPPRHVAAAGPRQPAQG